MATAATRTPVFPILEPQHYSDYGFDDPQLDHFQRILEEARRHSSSSSSSKKDPSSSRPLDEPLRFKLQKPISKDDHHHSSKRKKKRTTRWWNNALHFLKWTTRYDHQGKPDAAVAGHAGGGWSRSVQRCSHPRRAVSGPLYYVTSSEGPFVSTHAPCRRRKSVSAAWSEAQQADVMAMPYLNLRELNEARHSSVGCGGGLSAAPIYLVT